MPTIPQIRPALAVRPAADLAVAGVDLPDHAVAHHPGDRRDELARHQPDDAEDQHQGRLRVVRRAEARRRRRPYGFGG